MLAKSSVWQYELAEHRIALPVSQPKVREEAASNRMVAIVVAIGTHSANRGDGIGDDYSRTGCLQQR